VSVKSQQYQYPRPLSLSTAAITLPVPVPGLRRRVVVAARRPGQLARIGLDLVLAPMLTLGREPAASALAQALNLR